MGRACCEPALVWLQPSDVDATAQHGGMSTCMDSSQHEEPFIDPELQGKVVLLVLCGSPGRRRILSRLHAAGMTFVCYSPDPNRGWASDLIQAENWITGPVDDDAAAVSHVQAWLAAGAEMPLSYAKLTQQQQTAQQKGQHRCSRHRRTLDGIMCYDEYGVELAATLGQALHLPYASPQVAAELRCKHLFRSVCAAGGVACPRYMRLSGPLQKEDEQLVRGMCFPVVAKPTACAGSFSVVRCDTLEALRAAAQRYFAALPAYLSAFGLTNSSAACATGGMVVEELVVGNEVDIDCVVVRGQLMFAAVSDNHPPPPLDDSHAFVERGGRSPSTLPHQQQADLLRLARDVVGLWGTGLSGVFHLEAFSTPSGPVPIEINGRIGGAETYTNVLAVWGVDLGIQAARIALGLAPRLPHLTILDLPVSLQCEPINAAAGAATVKQGLVQGQVQKRHLAHRIMGKKDRPPPAECKQPAADYDEQEEPPHTGSMQPTAELLRQLAHQLNELVPLSEDTLDAQQRYLTPTASSPSCMTNATCSVCGSSRSSSCERTCREEVNNSMLLLTLNAPIGSHLLTDWLSPQESQAIQPDASTVVVVSQAPLEPALDGRHADVEPRTTERMVKLKSLGACEPERRQGLVAATSDPLHGAVATCLRYARPLAHVHSINFVPDWHGEGVVEVFEMSDAARHSDSYVDSELYCGPGAIVKLPPAGYSALGWMVARGRNTKEADEAIQGLMQGVTITLRPPAPSSPTRQLP